MHLFDAILDANHRAVGGTGQATLDLEPFADALPVAALTCIDARLNRLLPGALGLPEEQFVWLRNAGNIITGTHSSTLRSISLACAIKGAREIAVLGHTDCRAGQATMSRLIDAFKALGIDRPQLPPNLTEFFGLFASERQNIIRGVDFVRQSPLIGSAIPVHGLLLDIANGRLEWIVNGYQTLETVAGRLAVAATAGTTLENLGPLDLSELPAHLADLTTPTPAQPPSPPTSSTPPQPPSPSSAPLAGGSPWQWPGNAPPWTAPSTSTPHTDRPTPPPLPPPSAPPKLVKPSPSKPRPPFLQPWKRR
jgi:carbonic anhydrase